MANLVVLQQDFSARRKTPLLLSVFFYKKNIDYAELRLSSAIANLCYDDDDM